MSKNKIKCPGCRRDVAKVGRGANARFSQHNKMETVGWTTRVSRAPCEYSNEPALPIEIERAEQEHDNAKRRADRVAQTLEEVQAAVRAANAELIRTAEALDALRALKGGAK